MRPNDFTGNIDGETTLRVENGTTLAHTEHACITQGTITVGTTSISFSRQFVRANVRDWGARGTRQQQVLDHTMVSAL